MQALSVGGKTSFKLLGHLTTFSGIQAILSDIFLIVEVENLFCSVDTVRDTKDIKLFLVCIVTSGDHPVKMASFLHWGETAKSWLCQNNPSEFTLVRQAFLNQLVISSHQEVNEEKKKREILWSSYQERKKSHYLLSYLL